ncbi:MerR family transcriptional regulator [Shewanella colwelliana]|uniref:Cu(I)-responsive transcriptional regulator n=1 Tax=Shewanella colwelliana TaxID=23 RepID=A0A1E5IVJ8_SHECO|nr:MerR family DNA-binding protein [Shewanella colwelliana]MCZ4338469.1 MerR family DNA-binding protein [Shewanella colwelliana]MDX1281303.1 MerR family DNA-binding protein [Shewanella colwelliana]OEG73943.1 MerR family transcriptional regulator [Shewanella colwelliana]GIU34977.1 Cu(I)-responsive transcriptional regulator [Shewanella colwelliana]GIU39058.1 Cu(I)-responsive transcriptional regulator [Shewanella colwelliana]
MRVNQLAKNLNITGDTVRFYTRIGLLTPIKSEVNGYKDYSETDQSRMQFILSARNLGFSVDDIKVIFSRTDHGESACQIVRQMIVLKLQETEKQFQEMVKLRSKLTQAVTEWSTKPDQAPTGNMICHLIEGSANLSGANGGEHHE